MHDAEDRRVSEPRALGTWISIGALAAGALTTLLGVVVIVGWHTGARTTI